jgi:hypothetical protein
LKKILIKYKKNLEKKHLFEIFFIIF